jgi:hypothetical protein
MTNKYNFEMELTTTDDVQKEKIQMTIAKFIGRLTKNQKVLTANVTMDESDTTSMTEDERERLLSVIERIDRDKKQAAMEIVVELKEETEYE